MELSSNEVGKATGLTDLMGEEQEIRFGHVKFEASL